MPRVAAHWQQLQRLGIQRLRRQRSQSHSAGAEIATEYDDAGVAAGFSGLVTALQGVGLFCNHELASLEFGLRALDLESLRGLRVLDAGCGDGRNCRRLCSAGAQLIGCDSSESMVKMARQRQLEEPHDADYLMADVASSAGVVCAPVDLSLSVYVMQMAKDVEQLARFCGFLRRHSPRCLVFSVSGEYIPDDRQSELMGKYLGFQSLRVAGTTDQIHAVFGSQTVLNYQYPEHIYLECLQKAGFETAGAFSFHCSEEYRLAGFEDVEEKELLDLYSANPHVKCFWGLSSVNSDVS